VRILGPDGEPLRKVSLQFSGADGPALRRLMQRLAALAETAEATSDVNRPLGVLGISVHDSEDRGSS